MLHMDAGKEGVYEFPGADGPAQVGGSTVMAPFAVTGEIPAENVSAVVVADQAVEAGTVSVPAVLSAGPGWMVIHAGASGSPGPVVGFAPVEAGINFAVVVEIDEAAAGEAVFAMLHDDLGVEGTYEFPGADAPARAGGAVVMLPFALLPGELGAGGGSGEPGGSGNRFDVTITDSRFSESRLTIKAGDTVVWTHNGDLPHSATADGGEFDSGALGTGDTFEFTFTEPGEYAYYCMFHGDSGGSGMSGVIVVEP
jgi:plastocyanin